MPRSAFVAIVGRPSAGKSTLVNALCGAKVSIVSPVPQTTRNAIRGIVHRPEGQLVLLDTPGFHLSGKRLNRLLEGLARGALGDADIVLYLLDPTREPGAEEEALAAALAPVAAKVVIVLSKQDIAGGASGAPGLDAARAFALARLPGRPVLAISALRREGLDTLLSQLFGMAEEGPPWYPDEYYTDQEPTFRIAEVIREKAILHTREELPHAIYVAYRESRRDADGGLEAEFDLVVERESQKGILIGKGASMIKLLREESEAELAGIFDYPIRLRLRVVVEPDWRNDDKRLKGLIH